jgi:hypothetical protein
MKCQIALHRDPGAQEPESPSAAVVVEVRLDALTLPVERLMVKAGVLDTALIPVALIPLLRAEIVSVSAISIPTTVVAGSWRWHGVSRPEAWWVWPLRAPRVSAVQTQQPSRPTSRSRNRISSG